MHYIHTYTHTYTHTEASQPSSMESDRNTLTGLAPFDNDDSSRQTSELGSSAIMAGGSENLIETSEMNSDRGEGFVMESSELVSSVGSGVQEWGSSRGVYVCMC
jgi:hypothetical protein